MRRTVEIKRQAMNLWQNPAHEWMVPMTTIND
jgi:hypothetical protein